MDIRAVKIGMCGHPEVARAIYDYLKHKKIPLVLDPVMSAQSDGRSLFEEGALPYIKKLISISELVVLNAEEAETITGTEVRSAADADEAAGKILKLGAKAVLVTGIKSGVISDVFRSDFKFTYTKQIKLGGTKGGGCCLSAAVAAFLSMGISTPSAVEYAEGFVDAAISHKKKIGKGIDSLDPLSTLRKDSERYSVICNLKAALTMLETHNELAPFIPQVGTNLVLAIREAKNQHDVAGVVGRIRDAMGIPRSLGNVEFGASPHVSKVVLSAMKLDPERRSAMNIAVVPNLDRACKKAGFTVAHLDRAKGEEWDVSSYFKNGKMTDVIFYGPALGKEPCAFVFGKDAIEAAANTLKVIAAFYKISEKE